MEIQNLFHTDAHVYFVGIKGTGMCALAELMKSGGIAVSGSDIGEKFYTDAILDELRIPYYEQFDAAHITKDFTLVIYSAAYSVTDNPELAQAVRLSIPMVKYPDALGLWSQAFDSAGIAGVHGKTTTTALAGILAKALNLPAQVLAGSAVSGFSENSSREGGPYHQGRSTLTLGNKYFIAETCEYRKHFLAFHPHRILLTAVESDHQDFYPDYNSIRDAFIEYCRLLPPGGQLVFCADDPGASEVAHIIKNENEKIEIIPYGFSVSGQFGIRNYRVQNEQALFSINVFPGEFTLHIPGRHEALNTAGALALCSILLYLEKNPGENFHSGGGKAAYGLDGWDDRKLDAARTALSGFRGSKRRSEILGEAGGILFMDDYGHHPTAIRVTLEGLKSFYPGRRLVVSFMSHTYTRTAALLDEFTHCFSAADILFLHEIYSSVREHYEGGINGKTLYDTIGKLHDRKAETLYYTD
ncbi:MAG: UDP-N-acetylmuramate--L-alanine ligase, partial [Treponema sp.]|nr:UDP-N-acetylmuramate--L-alanine ligase [Treponema sp.]